jgi:hypothetical protein
VKASEQEPDKVVQKVPADAVGSCITTAVLVAGLSLVLLSLTGCSSDTSSASVNYGAKYLELVTPVHVALSNLADEAKHGRLSPDAYSGATKAITTFEAAALRVQWPKKSTARHVRALLRAESVVRNDLTQLASNTGTVSSNQGSRDGTAARTAADTVRVDLGLPATTAAEGAP